MFISPVDKLAKPGKKAWANYVIYDSGVFYAIFGTGTKSDTNTSGYAIAIDIAKSMDGVHWEFMAENILEIPGAHAGFGFKKIGEWFYYYPTCSNEEKGVHFKVFRSLDLNEWEHMGNKYDVVPDRRLYHERWDEIHVVEDMDDDGEKVYYGYITSETREDIGEPSCAFLQSYDGISWEVLPPVTVVWGEIPAQHMELNFVEKIEGKYYLSMSGRMYADSYGYSLYTFVGASPRGPFYPDAEKFRLSGTSRRDITFLSHSFETPEGFLSAQWLSHDICPDIPSYSFAIGDLRRIICDNGHLRFAYWSGTEAVKGEKTAVRLEEAELLHPCGNLKSDRDNSSAEDNKLTVSAGRDGVIAALPEIFDFKQGIFAEGEFIIRENRSHIATHQHAAGIGFFFGSSIKSEGIAMIAYTLGVTRSGKMAFSDKKITDKNEYRFAGGGLADGRSGSHSGTLDFDYDDTVGPFGHASYCGVRHGKKHHFRLLVRGDYFELYIDDLYVQTYLLPENPSGVLGLCCFDGVCDWSDIEIWKMNL